MSRADLNLRNKRAAALPQKPGRTAARERDRLRKNLTPRIQRMIAAHRLSVRSQRSQAAKAKAAGA